MSKLTKSRNVPVINRQPMAVGLADDAAVGVHDRILIIVRNRRERWSIPCIEEADVGDALRKSALRPPLTAPHLPAVIPCSVVTMSGDVPNSNSKWLKEVRSSTARSVQRGISSLRMSKLVGGELGSDRLWSAP
jgi:hypothetical protein